MKELMLFTDGSVNVQSRVGYGAYLIVADRGITLELLQTQVQVRRFEDTSSTKLELQTLLWALSEIQAPVKEVIVYTDSQNTIGLIDRRGRLEKSNYFAKNNKRLKHYELYQAFYRIIDQLNCEWVKVHGHRSSSERDETDRLFSLVDKASRSALRNAKK